MGVNLMYEQLIDRKIVKIIRFLIKSKGKLVHLQQISKSSGVSIGTVFRIIPKLVKAGVVRQVNVGKIKLYKVEDNKKTKELARVFG